MVTVTKKKKKTKSKESQERKDRKYSMKDLGGEKNVIKQIRGIHLLSLGQ